MLALCARLQGLQGLACHAVRHAGSCLQGRASLLRQSQHTIQPWPIICQKPKAATLGMCACALSTTPATLAAPKKRGTTTHSSYYILVAPVVLRLLCGPHRFTASSECETSLMGYLDPKTEHVQQRKYDHANFTARLVPYVTWFQVWDSPFPLEQYWSRSEQLLRF